MGNEQRTINGKYRLLKQIGEGGMGLIWEAELLGVGRRVALKLLRPDRARDEESRQRFLREVRAAGQIAHDNICEVFDFGTSDDGTPYYAMPLLSGRPLATELSRTGPLPLDRVIDIGAQLLSALDAAHRTGVIHRDLKPDNVFLSRLGDRDDFVKILDFGISKVLDTAEEPTHLTRTGAVLGTPHYMAPEQARGERDVDQRVDVFAAGAILYEMLTGCRAFEGETSNEILWNLWNSPLKPPRAHRREIPPAIEAVVLRALARDRDKRFPSASAMLDALRRAAVLAPDGAAPSPDAGEPTSPEAALTATTLTPLITGEDQATQTTETSGEPQRRRRTSWLVGAGLLTAAGLIAFLQLESPPSPRGRRGTGRGGRQVRPRDPSPQPPPRRDGDGEPDRGRGRSPPLPARGRGDRVVRSHGDGEPDRGAPGRPARWRASRRESDRGRRAPGGPIFRAGRLVRAGAGRGAGAGVPSLGPRGRSRRTRRCERPAPTSPLPAPESWHIRC